MAFGYVDAPIKVPVSGLSAAVSTYVPVSFQFQNAGNTTIQVLTVPAVGQYAGIVPITAAPTGMPTPDPSLMEYPSTGPTAADY